jgi:phosphohistidine swiveling domain-containing protein/DNA-binding protein YbaB
MVKAMKPEKSWRNICFFDTKTSDPQVINKGRLGGKGYSLVKMTQLGIPVPPGFTITTDVWADISEAEDILPREVQNEVKSAVSKIEEQSSREFGHSENPLICSVRSGAAESMPGLMATVLNVGITDKTLPGLIEQIGQVPALDAYQRLVRMYGSEVCGVSHQKFKEAEQRLEKSYPTEVDLLKQKVEVFKNIIEIESEESFEQNPWKQLYKTIRAVADSFMSEGAIEYRQSQGIPHTIGTAVNIQQMVFGTRGEEAGTAVIFTRDPQTGEREMSGHFAYQAQGEAVVKGDGRANPICDLPSRVKEKIVPHLDKIEELVGDVADIEVTWEVVDGEIKMYVLQSRRARLTPVTSVRCAVDMLKEGKLTRQETLGQLSYGQIQALRQKRFELGLEKEPIFSGEGLSTGVGVGKLYTDPDRAKEALQNGEQVILICEHFDPNDVDLIVGDTDTNGVEAICTIEGTPSSHMGIIMVEAGMAGIMGIDGVEIIDSSEIKVAENTYEEGEMVSVDGYLGKVYLGRLPVKEINLPNEVVNFVGDWEAKYGVDNPWADFLDVEGDKHTQYLEELEALLQEEQFQTYSSFPKVQQIYLESQFFPRNIHIHTEVVEPSDRESIKKLVRKAKREGYSVWARSANRGMKAPYTSSDLTREGVLDDWLENTDSSHSKWGGLDKWVDEENVEYILIGFDPKDKLNKDYRQEHFVGTLRCEPSIPTKVVIDIRDHSYHLRSLGEKDPKNSIRLTISAESAQPCIDDVNIEFGENFVDMEKLQNAVHKTKNDNTNDKLENLQRVIQTHCEGFETLGSQKSADVLLKLINTQLVPYELLDLVLEDRGLELVHKVAESVLSNWWGEYDLPETLWALREVTGASILELQGRISRKHDNWIQIYGTKGGEEARKIGQL